METTREIRWFLPRPMRKVDAWFASMGKPLENGERRTDTYLYLPFTTSLGLKLREGQLEPKKRIAERELGTLGTTAEGYYESWVKWSFSLEQESALDAYSKDHWLNVEKTRTTLYVYDADGTSFLHASPPSSGGGCQIEYARVVLNGKEWYSYCLEWFGGSTIAMDELSDTIVDSLELKTEDSFSYPQLFLKQAKK